METKTAKNLATARWIVISMYLVPLAIFPILGRTLELDVAVGAEELRILSFVLGMVALGDYALSLLLERKLLAQARAGEARTGSSPLLAAAVVVAALGASIAIYGLVLTLLGAPRWGDACYILCAVHGLHLAIRWPRYQRIAEGAPY